METAQYAANKERVLMWCKERLAEKDTFQDIIWSDECSIQLDCRGRLFQKEAPTM